MKLYETLAAELAQSIQDGVLRIGDRLPSVRQASTSRAISPSTVFQAYYLLEARGLIRARERSGYYAPEQRKNCHPNRNRPRNPMTPRLRSISASACLKLSLIHI